MQQESDNFQLFFIPLVCEYYILMFCFVLHFQGDIQKFYNQPLQT